MTSRPQIKICGVTRPEDLRICAAHGVDWVGLNFVPWSKRRVTRDQANLLLRDFSKYSEMKQKPRVMAVIADQAGDLDSLIREVSGIDGIQFHGSESVEEVAAAKGRHQRLTIVKVLPVSGEQNLRNFDMRWWQTSDILMFDTASTTQFGGTGAPFDWQWLRHLESRPESRPFGVAGGLSPSNLLQLKTWSPDLIDLNSGVETAPGVKDPRKIEAAVNVWRGGRGIA